MSWTIECKINLCFSGAVTLTVTVAALSYRAGLGHGEAAGFLGAGLALELALLGALFALARSSLGTCKRAIEDQRAERLYSERLVDAVREPLVFLTDDMRIASANRAFYEAFQLAPEAVVGLPLREAGGGQWAIPGLLEKLAVASSGSAHFNDMEAIQDISGFPRRTLLLSARELQRPGVNQAQILLTIRDVSALKAIEERIQALDRDLKHGARQMEEVNREMESFSYSVSHDLRAPLRHIDGFAQLLQKHIESTLDDTGRRFLRMIADSVRRLNLLIDELLAFSRMGRSEMRQTLLDMRTLVDEVLRDLLAQTQARDVEWRFGTLPAVRADPTLMRLVWANLIGNALKYTRRKPAVRIEIACQNGETEHIFSVRDNGAGFDERYLPKLFGTFQRLHSDDEFEGSGVGLATVRRAVQRHGGRTWAEGRVGEGAVFYFSLPSNSSPRPGVPNSASP